MKSWDIILECHVLARNENVVVRLLVLFNWLVKSGLAAHSKHVFKQVRLYSIANQSAEIEVFLAAGVLPDPA